MRKFFALTATALLSTTIMANTALAQDKVQIEYWHVNAETQGGKSVETLIENFNAQSDSVEVVGRFNPDMYQGLMTNLQAEVASGSSPAVIQVGWAFLDYFSGNFHYVEPQTLVDQFSPDEPTWLEDHYLPNIFELAENSDGSQVGFPYSLSNPVLYINRDLLSEAGVNPDGPTTWEEVEEFSLQIKEETGKYGLYIQEPADFWGQQALIESNGGRMIEDGKAAFASPEGIEAFEMYNRMVVIDETALHIGWDQGIQSFINGDVAMLFTTIAQRSNVQNNSQFDVTTVEAPTFGDKEKRLPSGGAMLVVTAQEEAEQEAAWEFMQYLLSTEGITEWTIGTGYVPPVVGVAEDPEGLKDFLAENEMMQPAIEQMDTMVPWASFPGSAGLQAEQLLQDMRDVILGSEVDVAEVMQQTQDEINSLLE